MKITHETGRVTRIDGFDAQTMSSYELRKVLGLVCSELESARHHIKELTGTISEFRDMPCGSLSVRMARAAEAADKRVRDSRIELVDP